jgi:hypothetical protein
MNTQAAMAAEAFLMPVFLTLRVLAFLIVLFFIIFP